MVYSGILNEFLEALPMYHEAIKKAKDEDLIDEDTGYHIVFGTAIVPYLIMLFENIGKNKTVIAQTFDFLEKMSKCDDTEVVNLLDITILEQLINEGRDSVEQFKKFMGETTLKQCIYEENFFII